MKTPTKKSGKSPRLIPLGLEGGPFSPDTVRLNPNPYIPMEDDDDDDDDDVFEDAQSGEEDDSDDDDQQQSRETRGRQKRFSIEVTLKEHLVSTRSSGKKKTPLKNQVPLYAEEDLGNIIMECLENDMQKCSLEDSATETTKPNTTISFISPTKALKKNNNTPVKVEATTPLKTTKEYCYGKNHAAGVKAMKKKTTPVKSPETKLLAKPPPELFDGLEARVSSRSSARKTLKKTPERKSMKKKNKTPERQATRDDDDNEYGLGTVVENGQKVTRSRRVLAAQQGASPKRPSSTQRRQRSGATKGKRPGTESGTKKKRTISSICFWFFTITVLAVSLIALSLALFQPEVGQELFRRLTVFTAQSMSYLPDSRASTTLQSRSTLIIIKELNWETLQSVSSKLFGS